MIAMRHFAGHPAMRFLAFLLAAFVQSASAAADGRVALLIGNAEYDDRDFALRNPANDVRALGDTLGRLGFKVRTGVDLSREEMLSSLEWLSGAAQDADIAMVFFAGHSIQAGSENFLIGVDLAELSASALTEASVTLTEIRAAIEGADTNLSMIVLDACRNNPLGDAEIGRVGLSPVSGGVGTLVAYSTDPGNVAEDGLGENSTFTDALLNHIDTPGIDVRIMFGRVRQEVVRVTGGQQVPWVEEAVIGEHYLSDAPAPLDPNDELRVWRAAVDAGSVEGYRGYIDQFPEGLYKIVAELRIDALQGEAVEAKELAPEELPQIEAALEMVGYIVPGEPGPSDEEVRRAYARWLSSQPGGGGSVDALMGEAARTATFLGTYTAGILRSDLQRFTSVEEALRTAEENLWVAEADFAGDPKAESVLREMRAEVAEIEAIRDEVTADVDASRTYYDDLLRLTDRYLFDWMADRIQPRFVASRGITRLSDRALSDAQTFYGHLAVLRDAPEGSYAWMASMMEDL